LIYCVVPQELAPELYEKLADYYAHDPNVEVIIDRRKGERRTETDGGGQRQIRDRRRMRVPGDFPPIDTEAD
jgi:hypothetical protein